MTAVRVKIFPILVALFLIVPIIEIYLLIKVGGLIGVFPTIGLVVLTAVIGVALLRTQGFQTYMRFNQAMLEGRVPATEIMEGVALLIGGALLLTPGFFTDVIGFICLIPPTRIAMINQIVRRLNPFQNFQATASGVHTKTGNLYEGQVTSHHRD